MKKLACQYNIIRFSPFVETEEFANIGVAIYSPKANKVAYRIAPKRFGRITQFFEDMDASIYQATVDNLNLEMKRFKKYTTENHLNEQLGLQVFGELMREKGSILKFSNTRVVLTDDIELKVEQLFQHYVKRSFAKKAYRENQMTKDLRFSLKQFNLDNAFKEATLSDGFHDAKFPFVHYGESDDVKGAIRPLAFEQRSRLKVVEHADTWSTRLRHLTKSNIVEADNVLITIERPTIDDTRANDYIYRFKNELQDLGIKVVSFEDSQKVIDFAKAQSA